MSDLSVLKRVTLFLILLLSAVSMYAEEEDDNELLKLLPQGVTDVTQVETLWLKNDNLTELPESIGELTNLRYLYLQENNLTDLPESIGSLTNLRVLALSQNKLTILPESIGNLASLEGLGLNENNLSTLPESIGNLVSLKGLGLSGNNLTELPESIGNLVNLRNLDLSENNLTELPESIGNLINLAWLGLEFTPLRELPESFGRLSQLSILYLKDTDLTPDLLKPLQKLGKTKELKIYLSSTRLTHIPNISAYSADIDFMPRVYRSYRSGGVFATTARLRVRSSYSLESEVLGVLDKGTELIVSGFSNEDYYKIEDIDDKRSCWFFVKPVDKNNKLEGWVFGAYLEYFGGEYKESIEEPVYDERFPNFHP